MKNTVAALSIALMLLAVNTSDVFAVNGFAISACYHDPLWYDSIGWSAPNSTKQWAGKIVRFDVENDAVVKVDTLFDNLGECPAISFNGDKVAFFEWGQKVHIASASTAESWLKGKFLPTKGTETAPSYIMVMNSDGTNKVRILQLPHDVSYYPGSNPHNAHLDWSADGWIYYVKPPATATADFPTNEIWKINPYAQNPASTNVLVGKLTAGNTGKQWMRRFSISGSGGRVAYQTFEPNENSVSKLPFLNNDNRASGAYWGLIDACNIAISISVNYDAHYMADHSIITMDSLGNPNATQKTERYIQKAYFGVSPLVNTTIYGSDGEGMKWAANSDKWICKQAGCDHGDAIVKYSNQILVNWIDKKAIVTTGNKKPSSCIDGYLQPSGISFCSDPGDFWIKNSANNPNGTKYENANGAWVTMAGAIPSSGNSSGVNNGSSSNQASMIRVASTAQHIKITGLDNSLYTAQILDISGRVLLSKVFRGAVTINCKKGFVGTALLKISSDTSENGTFKIAVR